MIRWDEPWEYYISRDLPFSEMKTRFRIMLVVTLIFVIFGSIMFGYTFGCFRNKAKMIVMRSERQTFQLAADKLQATFPNAPEYLLGLSNDTEVTKSVTSALLGANLQLNPSNYVFLSVKQGTIDQGFLRDPFGGHYSFRLVLQKDDQLTTKRTARIMVVTE